MIQRTKGIVLKFIKYGDTSLIVIIYTEIFGLQRYIVKGVRKSSRTSQNKISYFQPGAILNLEVYNNNFKQLQYIKEYTWSYQFDKIFSDVIKNAITTYVVELLSHSISEEESNPELYHFLEEFLIAVDVHANISLSNAPLFFTIQLTKLLGHQIDGCFTSTKNVLDLVEGVFIDLTPSHPHFLEGELAEITSYINLNPDETFKNSIAINRNTRLDLLHSYQVYYSLHLENFKTLKSLPILHAIL